MNWIGWMYQNGNGVSQDYTEAMKWYRKAADAGNAMAMRNIGWLYQHGQGVSQDYTEAMQWYRKAADAGNADAAQRLRELDKPDTAQRLLDAIRLILAAVGFGGWLYLKGCN